MQPAHFATALTVMLIASNASAGSTQFDADGNAVHWQRANVPLVVDLTGAPSAFEDLPSIAARATDAWNAVPGTTHLSPAEGSLGLLGYDPSPGAANHSGITVSTTGLPDPPADALAITLVTTRHDTGEILDTDVIFNARGHLFAALDAEGMLGVSGAPYDIQNTLTHELGHVLGLVEDPANPGATMYPTSAPGEVSKRTLSDADIASVRLAYAYAAVSNSSPTSASVPSANAGCGGARVAPWRGHSDVPWGFVALMALSVAAMRPRRMGPLFLALAAVSLVAAVPAPVITMETRQVVSHTARWTHGVIVTTARVRDARGAERTIEVTGGRVGDLEMRVFGAPNGADIAPGANVQLSGDRVIRIERAP